MKFNNHTYSELLDILAELNNDNYDRIVNHVDSNLTLRLLDAIGISAPHLDDNGTPCSENGDTIGFSTYKGVLLIDKSSYYSELVYCIALIDNELRLFRLNTTRVIPYPNSMIVALKYVENNYKGLQIISDDDEIRHFGRGSIVVDDFWFVSYDLGLPLPSTADVLYPEDYGNLDIKDFTFLEENPETECGDGTEEYEALKDEILLDDNDATIVDNTTCVPASSRSNHCRSVRINVSWEEPIDEANCPVEAWYNSLTINTDTKTAERTSDFHTVHTRKTVQIADNVVNNQALLDTTITGIENILEQFMDDGLVIRDWNEH